MISPARLAALIADWDREAAVARGSLRRDDYPQRCQDTVEALRELEMLQRQHREIICTRCWHREQLCKLPDVEF